MTDRKPPESRSKRKRRAAVALYAPLPANQAVLFEMPEQLAPPRSLGSRGASAPLHLPGDRRRGKRGVRKRGVRR
jgi:hypothetical protein